LRRVREYLGDETFCFTYGDGVGDVNITDLVAFHKREGRLATLTGVQPPGRYGALGIEDSRVTSFQEKPVGDGGWINGGFFVLEPKVVEYIEDDSTIWERKPMERLAHEGQMGVYKHTGYWQPMDTLREKQQLEEYWASGKAPWKVWK
jgi:glucose-1-phosphate cytidylyltransferase